MTSIFLSYARDDDEPFVQKLYDNLVSRDFNVWFDRESMPSRGLTFLQEIRDAIADRDRLVLVVGPRALTSETVSAEWRWALENGKAINPVLRIGEYADVPGELRMLDIQDFRDDARFAESFEKLVRQLNDPIAPVGKLVAVPDLPPWFHALTESVKALRELLLKDLKTPIVVTGASARVGLQGMGGIGKSVLAAALARHPEIRRAFPAGIFWIPLGQQPRIAELQRQLAVWLGGDGIFDGVASGKEQLRELLGDKAILLVLDDVWDRESADAFNIANSRSRILLTTRDASLVTALVTKENHYRVDLPDHAGAKAILTSAAQLAPEDLPHDADILIEECGQLPLALALCGRMVQGGLSWRSILDALHDHDLEFLSDDHPGEAHHRNVWKVMDVSIRVLSSIEQERFTELGVFGADMSIPLATIVALWRGTGGMSQRQSEALLSKFSQRSLVQRHTATDGSGLISITLHDLLQNFAAGMSIKRFGSDAALHQRLVTSYSQICTNGWASGPNDGYFLQHLCEHLIAAERTIEAAGLLLDTGWIKRMVDTSHVNGLIVDFDLVLQDEGTPVLETERCTVLRLVQGAMRLSARVLTKDPSQLASQLIGRLTGFDIPRVKAFCTHFEKATERPWLRPCYPSLIPPDRDIRSILTGQKQEVTSVAISADGRWAVSGSKDTTVMVWDLEKGSVEPIFLLEGHIAPVTSVAISADGNRVVSGSRDTTVRVWDLDSFGRVKSKRTLEGHKLPVSAVELSSEGRWLVSGSQDSTVIVWDLANGGVEPVRVLEGDGEAILSVALSVDGKRAVAGTKLGYCLVWDLEIDQITPTRRIPSFLGVLDSVALSADGRRVAGGTRGMALQIWDLDLDHDEPRQWTRENLGSVTGIALSADGNRLISGTVSGHIIVRDLDNGGIDGPERVLATKRTRATSVAISADGRRAISAHWEAKLVIWDLGKGTATAKTVLKGHTDEVSAVAVSADGKRAVSGSWDHTLLVWEYEKGKYAPKRMLKPNGQIFSVGMSADGKRVLAASGGGPPVVWDIDVGKSVKQYLVGNDSPASAVALSANGKRAVSVHRGMQSGEWPDTFLVWDLETGDIKPTFELHGHEALVLSVALNADGKHMVSGSNDATAIIWDLDGEGERHRQFLVENEDATIYSVAMSADGKRAISGSKDTRVKVWDLENGSVRRERILNGHNKGVTAVAMSADGKWGISGSQDETLLVWDLDEGKVVSKFYSDAPINSCAISENNRTIVVGGSFGCVLFLKWERAMEDD